MPNAREGGEYERSDHSHVMGFWGPPPRKLVNFERFYVRFNGFLWVLDQISVVSVTIFC